MDNFNACIEKVLDHEGGKLIGQDYGRGASKWGITLATYRETHPEATGLDIANLTRDQAREFYRTEYWARFRFDRITDPALAACVFDTALPVGAPTAIRLLQRTVGAKADGIMGPHTAAVVNATDPVEARGAFKILAEQRYRAVAEAHPERAGELPGWLARLEKA